MKEAMRRRRRQQAGQIFKSAGWWYIRFYDTRVIKGEVKRARIAKQVVPTQGITKAKAKELAKPLLAAINQPVQKPETIVMLSDFVEGVYLPRMQQQRRPSTYTGYRDIWEDHIRPRCRGLWLRDVRTCDVQQILDDIARPDELSRNSLRHVKSSLSGIFKFAKQQGYFDGENPARDTAIPPAREAEETYAYSLEEIAQILAVLPEPAATIFAVAAFTGARRGEVCGLLWENYRDESIHIERSVWHGRITEPKTRKSKGAIPVIAPLAKRLEFHRARMGNPLFGPMFPNDAGKPTDLNNVLNRVILPTLNRCALCDEPRKSHMLADHEFQRNTDLPEWHGWHAARRGLGTNLYRLGVPEKTIQAILRHANVSTTSTYYIKTAAADTQAAMAKLETEILGNKWAMDVVPPQTATVQ
jgi:integrase